MTVQGDGIAAAKRRALPELHGLPPQAFEEEGLCHVPHVHQPKQRVGVGGAENIVDRQPIVDHRRGNDAAELGHPQPCRGPPGDRGPARQAERRGREAGAERRGWRSASSGTKTGFTGKIGPSPCRQSSGCTFSGSWNRFRTSRTAPAARPWDDRSAGPRRATGRARRRASPAAGCRTAPGFRPWSPHPVPVSPAARPASVPACPRLLRSWQFRNHPAEPAPQPGMTDCGNSRCTGSRCATACR